MLTVTYKNLLILGIVVLIAGSLLTFGGLWAFGFFGYASDKAEIKAANDNWKRAEKVVQQLTLDAEKKSKEAELQRQYTAELEKKLSAKDQKTDDAIKFNDERRKRENEKLQDDYNADVSHSRDMSDDERRSDICTRLDRLAADNPELAEYRCQ